MNFLFFIGDLYAEPHFFFEGHIFSYSKILNSEKGPSLARRIDNGSFFVGAPFGVLVYLVMVEHDLVPFPHGDSILNLVVPRGIVFCTGILDKLLFYRTGMADLYRSRSEKRSVILRALLSTVGYLGICAPIIIHMAWSLGCVDKGDSQTA